MIDIAAALTSLDPNCEFRVEDNSFDTLEIFKWNNGPRPSKKQIEDRIKILQEDYSRKQYQRDRKTAYPSVEEQLDLLYHGGYDAWKEVISAIKNSYPKQ